MQLNLEFLDIWQINVYPIAELCGVCVGPGIQLDAKAGHPSSL